jgi:hypothetical protein
MSIFHGFHPSRMYVPASAVDPEPYVVVARFDVNPYVWLRLRSRINASDHIGVIVNIWDDAAMWRPYEGDLENISPLLKGGGNERPRLRRRGCRCGFGGGRTVL